ncbi:uncharacterized protein M6B38_109010 [Iris pallida]|uniref:Uncharacterized protein n=1 Tax=Iris pallida TaxID=29817 RepID=A0AAX6EGE9_IRIPA|nr:uncharacterized protein M6B38_109010 [Iris pallida]
MARIVARALPLLSRSSPPPLCGTSVSFCRLPPASSPATPLTLSSSFNPPRALFLILASDSSPPWRRSFQVVPPRGSSPSGTIFSSTRGFRKTRGRQPASKKQVRRKNNKLELSVKICIEEGLPEDPEITNIAEMLKLNAPMAMKIAFDGLKDSEYKSRDASITDVGKFEEIELSVLLCNDDFMQKLNKDWRGVDSTTDVLSMSQHIPGLDLPILMLGDIVISTETAARQAEERGHTLLDEIRILMVHGLLHLLGFDHELGEKAEAEMGKEEELVLRSLGWKGKGLIKSSYDAITDESLQPESSDGDLFLLIQFFTMSILLNDFILQTTLIVLQFEISHRNTNIYFD